MCIMLPRAYCVSHSLCTCAASSGAPSFSYSWSRCTLSGLLRVLDVVVSQEGRIALMKSNVAHKLDKALARPGRIDKMIYLGNIPRQGDKGMFERIYRLQLSSHGSTLLEKGTDLLQQQQEEDFDRLVDRFGKEIPDDVSTPAQLQVFLLKY
ncbi:hypothetical protein BDP55DRAFT_629437 [Colletotrichum godetiae]|uniref:Uncharacterized protein n=1 Tax=Colletotrichum godetiae TaxID=1209918 RepID=A0AAJ0EWL7_9PEZI|nr:uncharacterized protein BDP55DRAFT_629437 [Colletotrichum godetiae]KAK1688900.1 hypothetical protein BDP55DRAFT_629437 [Colletotrichum godetiae]